MNAATKTLRTMDDLLTDREILAELKMIHVEGLSCKDYCRMKRVARGLRQIPARIRREIYADYEAGQVRNAQILADIRNRTAAACRAYCAEVR